MYISYGVACAFFLAGLLRWPQHTVAVVVLVLIGTAASIMIQGRSELSIALLLAGPLLGSRFSIGALTLDNWISAAGIAVGVTVLPNYTTDKTRRRLALVPGALVLAIGISGLASGWLPYAALVRYAGLAMLALLVAGAVTSGFEARVLRILHSLLGIGAVSVLLQPVLQGLLPPYVDPDSGLVRYGGLFGHPNFAAAALAIATLNVLGRRIGNRHPGLVILLFGSAILVTVSVGATLTLLGAAAVLVSRRGSRYRGAFVLVGAVIAFTGAGVAQRLAALRSPSQQNSVDWRFERWKQALSISEQDRMFGLGWEGLQERLGGPAHSAYVALLVEVGVVGLVLVLGAVAYATAGSGLSVSGAAIMGFVLVTSLTDPILFYPATMASWLVVMVLGTRQTGSGEPESRFKNRERVRGERVRAVR
ncbi:O-antigen ligase family protein [Nocardioides marmotae]|uniref:O-antigen ligase family protein n=1 Tax=Nocardioides marmotae TaxID=2663857 RepID=UPI0012B664B9|nr:O-antigen ligase family protein [Nocardioides marmotae]MBC9735314.1 O-antigen ligase family protein [Nocardioides marmotae]MTB86414.1 hypothetical protein [Nocardioides marmotae]